MNHTLRSVVEEELQKAYERGVQDGMKQERALWELSRIGQEIELGISYEEANPPEPYCNRCGKKLGTEAYDVHTCTPKQPEPEELARLEQAMIEAWKPIPKKEWVGLTDAEAMEIEDKSPDIRWEIILAEAKLKEKNT